MTSTEIVVRSLRISHVEFRTQRDWGRARMVEWNGIFRLFRFYGILDQPRQVRPKFRNQILESVCSIRFHTQSFRNIRPNEKRPRLVRYLLYLYCVFSMLGHVFKFLTQVKSKTGQFEIVMCIKSLARL